MEFLNATRDFIQSGFSKTFGPTDNKEKAPETKRRQSITGVDKLKKAAPAGNQPAAVGDVAKPNRRSSMTMAGRRPMDICEVVQTQPENRLDSFHGEYLEEMKDIPEDHPDQLARAVHKVILLNAGGDTMPSGEPRRFDCYVLTFLSCIVGDQLGLTVTKRPDWTQVITGLFHQIDVEGRGNLDEHQFIHLMESALEYFKVPVPGQIPGGAEAKATALSLVKTADRHRAGEVKLKVHEFFQRYAKRGQPATMGTLTIRELGFLSIMIAGELNVNAAKFPDWEDVILELGEYMDEEADTGCLNEAQVVDVMEAALQHYGINRPSAPGEAPSAVLKPHQQLSQHTHQQLAMELRRREREHDTASQASGPSQASRRGGTTTVAGSQARKSSGKSTQVEKPAWAKGGGALKMKELHNEYDIEVSRPLGEGGQGTVYLATELKTGYERAVKFYSKKNARIPPGEDAKKEMATLKSLDHPKIQRLYDVFEDAENVYVVGEPYSGGDLTQLTSNAQKRNVPVTTIWLLRIMRQMLEGVKYLHRQQIDHCDLKEQNVMVVNNDNWREPRIVVIDFGLARHFKDKTQGGGTPGYIPPEVWMGKPWSAQGDVHSLGVIIYQMYSYPHQRPYKAVHFLPKMDRDGFKRLEQVGETEWRVTDGSGQFRGVAYQKSKDINDIDATKPEAKYQSVVNGFDERDWVRIEGDETLPEIRKATLERKVDMRPVSMYAGLPELLEQMLEKNPENRPDVAHVMDSPFFLQDLGERGKMPIPHEVLHAMSQVANAPAWRQALLSDIAERLNFSELSELNDMFCRLDQNGDGKVSRDELQGALAASNMEIGQDPVQTEILIKSICDSRTNNIPYTMFMGEMLASKDSFESTVLRKEFLRLDTSGDGQLDIREVKELLEGSELSEVLGSRKAEELMDQLDVNKDGLVSYEEFRTVVAGHKDPKRQARQKRAPHTGLVNKTYVQDAAEPSPPQRGSRADEHRPWSPPKRGAAVASVATAAVAAARWKGAVSSSNRTDSSKMGTATTAGVDAERRVQFREGDVDPVQSRLPQGNTTASRVAASASAYPSIASTKLPTASQAPTAASPVAAPLSSNANRIRTGVSITLGAATPSGAALQSGTAPLKSFPVGAAPLPSSTAPVKSIPVGAAPLPSSRAPVKSTLVGAAPLPSSTAPVKSIPVGAGPPPAARQFLQAAPTTGKYPSGGAW